MYVDRIVEYLEPPQFIKKVQEIDDKLEKMQGRIASARKTHDFFRRCASKFNFALTRWRCWTSVCKMCVCRA